MNDHYLMKQLNQEYNKQIGYTYQYQESLLQKTGMYYKFGSALLLLLLFSLIIPINQLKAQELRDMPETQLFRMGEGLVRIAEPGEIADTLNVWGDISMPGRYLVPTNMKLPEMISYARGPISIGRDETTIDWSQIRLEISVSRYENSEGGGGREEVASFEFRYNEPLPEGMRDFRLENNDIVGVRVRRRPNFRDYVTVIAPAVSAIATSLIIIDRIR